MKCWIHILQKLGSQAVNCFVWNPNNLVICTSCINAVTFLPYYVIGTLMHQPMNELSDAVYFMVGLPVN